MTCVKTTTTIYLILVILYSGALLANESSYRLATDDIISINVFNEPDLSLRETKINDDGNISVPLLGQVNVMGKTVSEIEKQITDLFGADYLVNPRVTVSIDEFRPFYINGEVSKPGSYPYRTGLTVEMAVTIAGGFTERASKQKIFIIRENKTERKSAVLNSTVSPGDIITVEESFF